MNQRTPNVSIVIPAYNEEKYIARCLRSLRRQDFAGSVEIIVVDNASTDATADIARREGARVVEESRRGVCYARQAGTAAAHGSIIISTDADTTFPTQWLSGAMAAFDQDTELAAVVGGFTFTSSPAWGRWYSTVLFRLVDVIFQTFHSVLYAPASNFAFTKSAWQAVGGYNTRLTQGGDEYDLLRKLKKEGKVIFCKQHVVQTSSRRLKYGLLYNAVVTLGLYYLLEYLLSHIFRRSIIGSYPAHRDEQLKRQHVIVRSAGIAVFIVLGWYMLSTPVGAKVHVPYTTLHRLQSRL